MNEYWRDAYPESLSVFDPHGDSDHSPILVYTSSMIQRSNKAYKYFSFLSIHPKFKDVIKEAWQQQVCVGSKLYTLGQKMRIVKAAYKRLNREGFGDINQRTKDSLAVLERVQADMLRSPSDMLFREEFVARRAWNFFSKAQ